MIYFHFWFEKYKTDTWKQFLKQLQILTERLLIRLRYRYDMYEVNEYWYG